MIIDTGLGATALRDIMALAGEHIDHWKFGFGTSALMPLAILEEKLALLHERDVFYPGGTLLEAAIVQQHCRDFMRHAKELGFGAVEVSEGTIDLPGDRRRRVIDCARDAGLVAITEVGRKDPKRQPTAEELAEQVLKDLTWGASWVIIEGRECGQGIGIYDQKGEIRTSFLDEIIGLVGNSAPRLIWEAPSAPSRPIWFAASAPMLAWAISDRKNALLWRPCAAACVSKRFRRSPIDPSTPAAGIRRGLRRRSRSDPPGEKNEPYHPLPRNPQRRRSGGRGTGDRKRHRGASPTLRSVASCKRNRA